MNNSQDKITTFEFTSEDAKSCFQSSKNNDGSNVIELDLELDSRFISEKVNNNTTTNSNGFRKTFNKVLSLGLSNWLEKQRMIKAKSLLINSDLLVNEIAFEVGYMSSENFLKDYKKQFKLSPQEQRSELKIEVMTTKNTIHT